LIGNNFYKLEKTEESSGKNKRPRNQYLRLLTDEELDILEILAKKTRKTIERVHADSQS
jgi:hypothetical protein